LAPNCPTQIYFVTDIKTGQILFHFFHTRFLPDLNVCELQIHESRSSISEHTAMKKALQLIASMCTDVS